MKTNRLYLLGFCVVLLSACGEKQEDTRAIATSAPTEESDHSTTMQTQDKDMRLSDERAQNAIEQEDTRAIENAQIPEESDHSETMQTQVIAPRPCDERELNAIEAESWSCIDGIWLCLKTNGCRANGLDYPKWGYLGDKAPGGYLPQMPANHTGYELKWNTVHGDRSENWMCVKPKCICGGVEIKENEICINDTMPTTDGFMCGTTVCKMADTCRDGACWCGETPQTDVNIEDYICLDGKPVCNNL